MKNSKKQQQHLLEQIEMQKKIIEGLNNINNELLRENAFLKSQGKNRCASICNKCGHLFLFSSATDCCCEYN